MVMSIFKYLLGSSPARASGSAAAAKKEDKAPTASRSTEEEFVVLDRPAATEEKVKEDQKDADAASDEEEEPLYEPMTVHYYTDEKGTFTAHPDERQMPRKRENSEDSDASPATKDKAANRRNLNRKDRHSADAKSSINRSVCQKKGGAGGNFTWSGASKLSVGDSDVPVDYVPDALGNQMQNVSVAPARVEAQAERDFVRFQLEQAQFPALGGAVAEAAEHSAASAFWKHAVREDADLIPAM